MAGMTAQQLQDYDRQVTADILGSSEDMLQPIFNYQFVPSATNNILNIPMRQVGLTRGFLVKIVATLANTGTAAGALTPFGAANLLSSAVVTDLDNYQRVNTSGWHLNMLNSAKEGWPFGAALLAASQDGPVKYGNNFSVLSAPASIANAASGTVQMYYWVPCAYGKHDLRGAIYTGVTNATAYLSLTLNPTPGIPTGDSTLGMYSGINSALAFTSATVTVYQNYLDQLPRFRSGPNQGAPVLPPLSIGTQYRLVNTSLTGLSAGQQFPIPFTNFQSFLSASVIYDQAGTLAAGTDITSFALTAANTLQFFNLDPITQALRQRVRLKTDFPIGTYMFDFREQPINTNQAGNIQLNITPATAAAGSQVLIGWESFANVNTILGAQSLAAN